MRLTNAMREMIRDNAMKDKFMKLERIEYCLGHKTGTIHGLTATEISERLGNMDQVDDDEAKVKYSWAFEADGQTCGIWDYYGSGDRMNFSTYGPHEIFIELFGDNYRGGAFSDF